MSCSILLADSEIIKSSKSVFITLLCIFIMTEITPIEYHRILIGILLPSLFPSNLFTSLYFSLLFFTFLYFSLLFFAFLYFSLLFFTSLYFSLLFFTFLHFPSLFFTFLYFSLLFFTFLYFSLLFFIQWKYSFWNFIFRRQNFNLQEFSSNFLHLVLFWETTSPYFGLFSIRMAML